MPQIITQTEIAAWNRDGYVILDNLFTPREVEILINAVKMDQDQGSVFGDAGGRTARLAFWGFNDLHTTIWGAASICPRVVNNVRILMGEEMGFFHGKVTLKEARSGGAWEWHQDYGYWYDQGYVTPRMLSVFVALDRTDVDNGCLQVLRGSHQMGRLNHGRVAGQAGADVKRLDAIKPYFEQLPVVLEPGSALFFHSNTLHSSGPNDSGRHRRCFIMCYNALSNPQIGEQTSQRVPCPVGADDVIERFAAPAPAPGILAPATA